MNRNSEILIEPFGIETNLIKQDKNHLCILIEPFGIETCHGHGIFIFPSILIEPFGIETSTLQLTCKAVVWILIEPFGIETENMVSMLVSARYFN